MTGVTPPRISLAFQGDKTPQQYVDLAQLVDRFAFDTVSVYNDLLYQPALGPLLLMAPHLRHARLGPAALNPYTVHPLEIAGQAAMLDMVSEGRAYLGLARGAWLDALSVQQTRPLQTLREAILLIRHLLTRSPESFTGEVFSLAANATLRYQPIRSQVPIMVGTWGTATARMAGEVADEVKIGGSANPAMAAYLRPFIDAGSADAGRAPGSVSICLGAVTVVDTNRAVARQRAREEVALYLPVVAHLDPTVQDREWLARLAALEAQGDRTAIARAISDEMLDTFAFSGTPSDILDQVHRLAECGVERVEFGTPLGVNNPAAAIRLLGEQVLPELDRER